MKFESIPQRVNGRIGSAIRYFPTIPSTNDYLLTLDGATDGLVVVTDLQTSGRGRGANKWAAAAGENLLFSIVVYLDTAAPTLALLPVLSALGVCEALDQVGVGGVMTKWPNDIVADDKKLCGILIESRVQGNRARTVAGIGLNVNQIHFPSELMTTATSLARLSGTSFDRQIVLGRILDSVDRVIFHLDPSLAIERYTSRCATIGERVAFRVAGLQRTGRATGIDEQGRLLIEERGSTTAFFGSEVTHLRPAP